MGVANQTFYKVVGSSDIIQLPDKRTWNLTDGVQTFKRFAGTEEAIRAKFNELSATADSGVDDLDEDITGKSGKLTARVVEDSGGADGGNTDANAIWELNPREILRPIETHRWFDLITSARAAEIQAAVCKPEALAEDSPVQEVRLYAYYAHGVLDFAFFELELRKSLVLSTRSDITASYTGLNRVVTLASISPPSVLIGSLTSLPLSDGTSGGWEWLHLAPQVAQIGKGKFRLTETWRGAERWATIYGGSWVVEDAD